VSRDVLAHVVDMLDCARRIEAYSRGLDLHVFREQGMAYDAVLRNLEVLGEAAKGVTPELRLRHPEVQWRSMAGLRDVLIHRYFGLEDETLWDVVVNEIPVLITALGRVLAAEGDGDSQSS
jgi:uncharacterized protein with HEPN domain